MAKMFFKAGIRRVKWIYYENELTFLEADLGDLKKGLNKNGSLSSKKRGRFSFNCRLFIVFF